MRWRKDSQEMQSPFFKNVDFEVVKTNDEPVRLVQQVLRLV
jgi:hypothetical protein